MRKFFAVIFLAMTSPLWIGVFAIVGGATWIVATFGWAFEAFFDTGLFEKRKPTYLEALKEGISHWRA